MEIKIECVLFHAIKKWCILIRLIANICTIPSICISYNRMSNHLFVCIFFQFLIAFITRYSHIVLFAMGEKARKSNSPISRIVSEWLQLEKSGTSHSLHTVEFKKTNHKLTFIYLFTIFNFIFACHSLTCALLSLSGYHIHLSCASNIVFIINSFFPMQFDSQLESRLIYWHFWYTLTDVGTICSSSNHCWGCNDAYDWIK